MTGGIVKPVLRAGNVMVLLMELVPDSVTRLVILVISLAVQMVRYLSMYWESLESSWRVMAASPLQQYLHGLAVHVSEARPQVRGDLAWEPVRVLGMGAQGFRCQGGVST